MTNIRPKNAFHTTYSDMLTASGDSIMNLEYLLFRLNIGDNSLTRIQYNAFCNRYLKESPYKSKSPYIRGNR